MSMPACCRRHGDRAAPPRAARCRQKPAAAKELPVPGRASSRYGLRILPTVFNCPVDQAFVGSNNAANIGHVIFTALRVVPQPCCQNKGARLMPRLSFRLTQLTKRAVCRMRVEVVEVALHRIAHRIKRGHFVRCAGVPPGRHNSAPPCVAPVPEQVIALPGKSRPPPARLLPPFPWRRSPTRLWPCLANRDRPQPDSSAAWASTSPAGTVSTRRNSVDNASLQSSTGQLRSYLTAR